jgi:hypothetical protein
VAVLHREAVARRYNAADFVTAPESVVIVAVTWPAEIGEERSRGFQKTKENHEST